MRPNYKIICKNQFTYGTMQVRHVKKIPVSLLTKLAFSVKKSVYNNMHK